MTEDRASFEDSYLTSLITGWQRALLIQAARCGPYKAARPNGAKPTRIRYKPRRTRFIDGERWVQLVSCRH